VEKNNSIGFDLFPFKLILSNHHHLSHLPFLFWGWVARRIGKTKEERFPDLR